MPEATDNTEPNPQELQKAVEDVRDQYLKLNIDPRSQNATPNPSQLIKEWTATALQNPAFTNIINDLKTRLIVSIDIPRDPKILEILSSYTQENLLREFLMDICIARRVSPESSQQTQEQKPIEEEVAGLTNELDLYMNEHNKSKIWTPLLKLY